MAVIEKTFDFTYKKGDALPPKRIISYTVQTKPDGNDSVVSRASVNWLVGTDKTLSSSKVGLNTNVNILSPGIHTGELKFYHRYREFLKDPDAPPKYREDLIYIVKVNITIKNDPKTEIVPKKLDFAYQIGGNSPEAQKLLISSVRHWTLKKDVRWMTLSTYIGHQNGEVLVSVDPEGLAAGKYTGNVTLTDGQSTIKTPVTLTVTSVSVDHFLQVFPEGISFEYTKLGTLPLAKKLHLNSSKSWNISVDKTWVRLSKKSGDTGAHSLEVSLVGIQNFSKGTHQAVISVSNGEFTKTVSLSLTIFEFVKTLLSSSKLYFTDDKNEIEVSPSKNKTYLKIASLRQSSGEQAVFKVPFFKGRASKFVGPEVRQMLGGTVFSLPLSPTNPEVISPYAPAQINYSISENTLFEDSQVQKINNNNISFLKGRTPLNNWISENYRVMVVSPNGLVCFSFLNARKAEFKHLYVNGTPFYFPPTRAVVNTVIVPLSVVSHRVGDSIRISISNINVDVVVKEPQKEKIMLYWENKWGCIDGLELSGELKKEQRYKHDFTQKKRGHNTEEKSLVLTNNYSVFKINTGFFLLDGQLEALDQMMRSKQIYLDINNELIPVICTSKKLEVYKTNNTEKKALLTFENTIR